MCRLQKDVFVGVLCGFSLLWTASNVAQEQKSATDRNQKVTLSDDGLVAGRVVAIDGPSRSTSPLSGVNVFFVQGGAVARSSVTDSDGMFVVDGLTPGVYSFIGSGAKGFVAYGVVVEAATGDATSETLMVAAAVSPRFVALNEIVAKHLPRKTPVLLEEIEMKTSLDGLDQLDDGSNRIALKDGKLSGSLRTVANDTNLDGTKVFLIQNDEIVSESTAGENGSFTFDSVAPGVYDFVAAGTAGFTAIGFEAVQEGQAQTIVQQEGVTPSQTPAANAEAPSVLQNPPTQQELNSLLTAPGDGQIVADQVGHAHELSGDPAYADAVVPGSELAMCGDAIGCGAACGATGCGCEEDYFDCGQGYGGCCGGGGGAWYGGLAPLASAALFAWAISELDDDDNPNNPPPSSPNN